MIVSLFVWELGYNGEMRRDLHYQSLQTVREVGRLEAKGALFFNGVSNRYDTKAPQLVRDILSREETRKL